MQQMLGLALGAARRAAPAAAAAGLLARRGFGQSNLIHATKRRKYLKSLNRSMPNTGVSAKEWSRRFAAAKLLEQPDPRARRCGSAPTWTWPSGSRLALSSG